MAGQWAQYNYNILTEGVEQYCPGGYHPVYLNDKFKDGRYEILHKLGFGACSTVWLAQDTQTRQNVSIKVVVARKSGDDNRELAILRAVKEKGDPHHPGRKHVAHFLDSLYVQGPNGRHLCIISELLGPKASDVTESSPGYRIGGHLARQVSRQLLLAVDYLHSCGIAHGDIHMGNVLFRLSESQRSSTASPEELEPPEKSGVSRKDGSPSEENMPAYLVEPIKPYSIEAQNPEDVQLVDFGEAFFVSDPPGFLHTPLPLHPPELVFQRPLTKAVDIWILGSTTYEFVTGEAPFESDFNNNELIPEFQTVVGNVPETWIREARSKGIMDENFNEGFHPLAQHLRSAYFGESDSEKLPLGEEDMACLEGYLRKMLVVDPNQRATSGELLSDPWVAGKPDSG